LILKNDYPGQNAPTAAVAILLAMPKGFLNGVIVVGEQVVVLRNNLKGRVAMPDFINGLFELSGCWFILLSILRILKTKSAKGVHWLHPAFFSAWGSWNLYYYPHLGQWISFIGGFGVLIANSVWVILLLKYWRRK